MLFRFRKRVAPDARSGRMILLIECILNQNARDEGAATAPALNEALLALCLEHRIGILQMPCPEIHALGPHRERPVGCSLRQAMEAPAGRASCRRLSLEVAERAQGYLQQGMEIIAVIGGNPLSPGCAVHYRRRAADRRMLSDESGIFMQELANEFRQRDIDIPFFPLRDADPAHLAADLRSLEAAIGAK